MKNAYFFIMILSFTFSYSEKVIIDCNFIESSSEISGLEGVKIINGKNSYRAVLYSEVDEINEQSFSVSPIKAKQVGYLGGFQNVNKDKVGMDVNPGFIHLINDPSLSTGVSEVIRLYDKKSSYDGKEAWMEIHDFMFRSECDRANFRVREPSFFTKRLLA